jgi:hypothetical protein
MRLYLMRESSDVTEAVESKRPVVHLGVRDETNRVTGQQDAAKILSIVVPQHANIPRTSRLSDLTTHKPVVLNSA